MTTQGHALARFRRALASGSPLLALAAAAELPRVEPADATALVLLLADDDDADRFARAAVRLHARLLECAELPADESALLRAALLALRGPARRVAASTVAGLAELHDLAAVRRAVDGWLERLRRSAGVPS